MFRVISGRRGRGTVGSRTSACLDHTRMSSASASDVT